jgi:hypothetical protein
MITINLSAIESPFLSKSCTGLGNVLFQVSSAYGISKKINTSLNLYYLNKYCTIFEKFRTTIFRNFDMDNIREPSGFVVSANDHLRAYRKFSCKDDFIINGYLESYKYFDECKDDIIEMLQPDSISLSYIRNKYPVLFDNNITCISIHIRNHHTLFGVNLPFIETAINYIKKTETNVKFLVFSDDSTFRDLKDEDIIYIYDNEEYLDMWMMSLCKHNILSHSTLAWWGAYLNKNEDKKVIYSNTGAQLCENSIHDYYPPTYIGLNM